MLNTTQAFKNAVKRSSRASTPAITFGVQDVTAKDEAVYTASSSQSFSNLVDLHDNWANPVDNIATFEKGLFKLDGSFILMPDDLNPNDHVGWWSAAQSGSNGVFTTPPVLTATFPNNHSCLGLVLYFDPTTYCTSFHAQWYRANVLLDEITVTDNTSRTYNLNRPVVNFDKLVLTFLATDQPYRYVKLHEIDFGFNIDYDAEDIISASILEEVDPSGATLSVNTLRVSLINKDQKFNMLNPEGLYAYLQKRQRMVAKVGLMLGSGNYEFVDLGTYYLSNWINATGLSTQLECTDIIGVLDRTQFYTSPLWVNEPIENVLNYILTDAGFYRLKIDPSVASEKLSGYIPPVSHREAIHTVLLASRATLRVDRDSTLYVFRPNYSTASDTIDYNNMIGSPKITQKQLITAVDVTEYRYTPGTESKKLYEATFEVNGSTTLVIPYNTAPASNVSITISGSGSITSFKLSVTCAVITITGTGAVTLTVTGTPYIESTRIVRATSGLLPAGELPQVATVSNNKLISKSGQAVAEHLLQYYSRRIKQTFGYWHNPALQAGDCITVETMFGENYTGVVESQEIGFAPALKGKVEVTG